ncbi:hypothetical protein [uncultured Sunxiuqinia sp.]|uniref:hypothetical protein n=1 Tax=uncultured Sunxiuqinia sp. TaxID=1573825 RepID=UPI002AA74A18|nr:hypothetical protein [uncultured Sunxiuqinia sp.]
MFFIGLAGSFIPYLLLFGALFVLTMGINLRGNTNEKLAELTEKNIQYQDDKSQSAQISANDNCCYFFDVLQKTTPDYKSSISALDKVDMLLVPKPETNSFTISNQRKYSFDIYHTFFGLSPPIAIS